MTSEGAIGVRTTAKASTDAATRFATALRMSASPALLTEETIFSKIFFILIPPRIYLAEVPKDTLSSNKKAQLKRVSRA